MIFTDLFNRAFLAQARRFRIFRSRGGTRCQPLIDVLLPAAGQGAVCVLCSQVRNLIASVISCLAYRAAAAVLCPGTDVLRNRRR